MNGGSRLDVAQQRGDVLADVVVARAFAKRLRPLLVVRQRLSRRSRASSSAIETLALIGAQP